MKLVFKLISENAKNWKQNFEVKLWDVEVKTSQAAIDAGKSAFLLANTESCIIKTSILTSNQTYEI